MPLYEYECQECGQRTEVIQRFDDAPLASCPECGGSVRRLISAPAVQFKGSGWYVTDYARKRAPEAKEGAAKADDGGGGKEAKTEKPQSKKAEGAAKAESA